MSAAPKRDGVDRPRRENNAGQGNASHDREGQPDGKAWRYRATGLYSAIETQRRRFSLPFNPAD